jgi:hypothetical protein
MKISKKLISAIVMLTLSFVMLVASSFAWFAMNDNVSATGMKVTAKGDQIYLQISEEEFDSTDNGVLMNTVAFSDAEVALLPVSPRATDYTGDYAGGALAKWVTAVGTSNSDGAALGGNYTKLESTEDNYKNVYFIKKDLFIRLDPTAGAEKSNALRVESVTYATSQEGVFQNCLSVLVVSKIGETYYGDLWENATGTMTHNDKSDEALSDAEFLKDQVASVSIYIFFDGDNGACTLKDLAAAKEAIYTVSVNFTVKPKV